MSQIEGVMSQIWSCRIYEWVVSHAWWSSFSIFIHLKQPVCHFEKEAYFCGALSMHSYPRMHHFALILIAGGGGSKKKNRFYKAHSRNVIYHNHLLQLLSSEGVTSYTQSSEAVTSYTHSSSCSDFSHVKQSSHTYQFLSYKHHLKESRPLWIILYTMIVFFWLRSSEGEVGGWGRDPKKCTGRGWRMGSSTV